MLHAFAVICYIIFLLIRIFLVGVLGVLLFQGWVPPVVCAWRSVHNLFLRATFCPGRRMDCCTVFQERCVLLGGPHGATGGDSLGTQAPNSPSHRPEAAYLAHCSGCLCAAPEGGTGSPAAHHSSPWPRPHSSWETKLFNSEERVGLGLQKQPPSVLWGSPFQASPGFG